MSKGTASDIAREADILSTRFSELMNMDETDKLVNQLGVMEVTFQASDAIGHNSSVNIVGKTIAQKTNTRRATVEKTSVVKQTTTGTLFKIVFANLFKIHSQN